MISKYLYNNNKQIPFGTNGFMVASFFTSKAQLKAWDWSKKWSEIVFFFFFFREEKETDQRYKYILFNHMFISNLLYSAQAAKITLIWNNVVKSLKRKN